MRRKRSGGEGESKWRRREQVRGREQVERERAGGEGESRWRGREQVERERAGGKGGTRKGREQVESRWNVTIGSEEIGPCNYPPFQTNM